MSSRDRQHAPRGRHAGHASHAESPALAVDRRRFLCLLGAGSCALATTSLAGCEVAELKQSGDTPDAYAFDIATLSGLATVGGMAGADVGLTKLLLIRTADDKVVAIARTCSHAGLDMTPGSFATFDAAAKTVQCGWHGSKFGLDGAVISGPATAAIASYPVTFDKATGAGTVDLAGVA